MNPNAKSPPVTAHPPRRVLMALGYYDPQLHRGITRYAREAGWVLDTSMAHYGVIPDHWRGDGVITILLSERGDITRFISRNRMVVADGALSHLAMTYLLVPGSLAMERKMLLGIKRRAERLAQDRPEGQRSVATGPAPAPPEPGEPVAV